MNPMLEYRQVAKTYPNGERAAVSGVSLTVSRGEMLTFVGESGCGKTTLLRLAAGLEAPDEGAVVLDGRIVADAANWVPPERRGVGLVFQGGALFPHLTVERNVAYGLHDVPKPDRPAIVEQMLALVGLPDYGRRFPHELSGGERQRLALARALAPRPNVVLLDEPFSNLDRCLRCALRDEIRRILKNVGATSILVTHDTDDALLVGDRVAVFRAGRLEQLGTPDEIQQQPASEYCAQLFCLGAQLARSTSSKRSAAVAARQALVEE
jgi:iron(III) transport system ATP-binding protein